MCRANRQSAGGDDRRRPCPHRASVSLNETSGVRRGKEGSRLEADSHTESSTPAPGEARESLEILRRRYNDIRPHRALIPPDGSDPLSPADVYVHGQAVGLPTWQGWAKAARKKPARMIRDVHLPLPGDPSIQTAAWRPREHSRKINPDVSS